MTGIMSVLAGMGSGSGGVLDSQTIVCGSSYIESYPFFTARSGYIFGSFGICTSGTSAIYGAQITELDYLESGFIDSPPETTATVFKVSGTVANSGWTTMTVNGTDFLRTDAAFATGGGVSSWSWSPSSNPFFSTLNVVWT